MVGPEMEKVRPGISRKVLFVK